MIGAFGEWLANVRPVPMLAVLVALQLAQAVYFGLSTPHNGWIWYSGGDATSYWTEQWAVGHFQIPQAVVGYGLPVLYAWAPLVAGPSLITGVPVIVVLQVALLVPLALILFWLLADRLFGRVYAWAAAALWVAGPLLLLHGFVPKYHWIFDQLFLAPHWYGFTNMADLPSVVIVLAIMWLTLRAVDERSPTDAAIAGLLAGLSLGIKPSNAFFVPAVAVLLVGSRQWRQLATWTAGIVPGVITLTIWKARGLGYLPLTSSSYARIREAAGDHPLALTTHKYLPFDFHHFGEELANLREVFWSLRFLEFLVFAGAFGVIRKSPLRGLFIVAWFAAFDIVKTSSPRSDFPSATYFRLGEPGLPAFILMVVGIAFCLPSLGRTAANFREPARAQVARLNLRLLVPVAIAIGAVPLLLVATLQNPKTMHVARDGNIVQEAPLTNALDLRARRNADGTVTVSWRRPKVGSAKVNYLIYLSTTGSDNGCTRPASGANECSLDTMQRLAVTASTSFVDRPQFLGQARWYRIGVLATFQRNVVGGDLMLVSSPVAAPPAKAS